MRSDPIQFALANEAANREPRFVVRIEFDTASPHITSHSDITGVPGDVMHGMLQRPSAISQKIIPDEGRSEIGSFTFTLVDKDKQFTDAMRAQLTNENAGLRRRKVEFYVGYKGMDFSAFQLFQTQIIARCRYRSGAYEIQCADITRELRKEVFRPASTTLRDSVSAAQLSIAVYDTSKLIAVEHDASYSDAPSRTVGYVRIEDEVIRWSDKTPDTLIVDGPSGRGCLNTKAVAHAVDQNTSAERRTKVEEFIYLEGPGPKIALAVMTGQIYGSSATLPENWNLGIPSEFVRTADYTGIGIDLWNPADDTASLVFRWDGLKQQDGKSFIEKGVFLLLGCYSPVYSDGALGLRQMTAIISDASPVMTLTEREIVELSPLEHEFTLLHNNFRIDWAWNPIAEGYERSTGFFDADSIVAHGEAPLQSYEFKGLHSQRATDSTIAVRLDSIRDRYSEPPQILSATILGSLNRLEVGDIVRIRVPESILRDFAGVAGEYNRSFEIQQKTYDAVTGDVSLSLFGSSARPDSLPSTPDVEDRALPDAWYTSAGAILSSVIPIAGGLASPGNYTLTGATALTASGAIFYWDGDLTIPNGCNITLDENVQLRVRGFITNNGTISGVGNGRAGVADAGGSPWDTSYSGNIGWVGNSRGWDGLRITRIGGRGVHTAQTIPAVATLGRYESFPYLTLSVVGGELIGLPDDLRGTGGAPGGRIVTHANAIASNGGSGAAGGAGLAIICRGMSFGVSALIDLSGSDSVQPSIADNIGGTAIDAYPGCGGAGGPGALLILLDGNNISIPVITGKFVATTGSVPQQGNPLTSREMSITSIPPELPQQLPGNPHAGYDDPAGISDLDMSNAAHRIQYVPIPQDPDIDDDPRPPAPTNLAAGNSYGANVLTWSSPDLDSFDVIDIFASIDNNRTNAEKVGDVRGEMFIHQLPLGGLRYYWIRAKLNPVSGRPAVFSEWEPEGQFSGVVSNADTPGEIEEAPDDFRATGRANGIQFSWSLPWAKLSGLLQLYEHTSSTPFSAATRIWEGYALGIFIPKADTTTRYYWLVLTRGGQQSVPEPPVEGLAAAASSATSALSVICSPDSLASSAGLPPPNPKTVTSASTAAFASGGTGPYTYLWTFDTDPYGGGGLGLTINSPTSATTTFSGTNAFNGTTLWGTARCTVTDSLSATASATVFVQINWPSIS